MLLLFLALSIKLKLLPPADDGLSSWSLIIDLNVDVVTLTLDSINDVKRDVIVDAGDVDVAVVEYKLVIVAPDVPPPPVTPVDADTRVTTSDESF